MKKRTREEMQDEWGPWMFIVIKKGLDEPSSNAGRGCLRGWAEKSEMTFYYQKDPNTTTPMEEVCERREGLYCKMNPIWSYFILVSQ